MHFRSSSLFSSCLSETLLFQIKYGYFRPEDYAMLGEDPPKWVEDNTNRRLVGLGWSNPSQYPGLI